jgi:acetyl esterase/lipase
MSGAVGNANSAVLKRTASMRPIDEVRAILKALVGGPDTPFMERRARSEKFAAEFLLPPGICVEQDVLGSVPVEWIHPNNAHAGRVFFHLHGGGYVLGNPARSRPFTTEFALKARCHVVSIDYRLAPEHPFPAAVTDALVAYSALLASGQSPETIAIGGEFAGGGLAVATLIAARNAHLAMPAALLAISPWTDMDCSAPSIAALAHTDPLLSARTLREMADAYIQRGDPRAPTASPAHADLHGLPPMLIHVGSEEVLLDDAKALERRARVSGANATLEIWPGMIHAWHMFHDVLPEADEAIAKLAQFVRRRWDALTPEGLLH